MRLSINSFNLGRHKVLIAGILFFFALTISGAFTQVRATSEDTAPNGRLITIHDRGQVRVILSNAQNIRDALRDAKVNVFNEDLVEPGLDEPLVATDYTVNIYRARPVIVEDGPVREKIMTAGQTPKSIAAAAGIVLRDEDRATVTANPNIVIDGASVVLKIDRATTFTLNLFGKITEAYSHADTVGDMLKSKGIKLGKDDTLSINQDAPLTSGMLVAIYRNGIQTVTVEELIAFPTRQIQDVSQPVSYRKIDTPGVAGKKLVTYEITMQNGQEIKRAAIQTVIKESPKEQVETVGAKPSFSGDFAEALARLRSCESGGNYANKRNPLYRGAYQFSYQTWANKYGIYDPADASPAQQDQAAQELYARRGWQPWPACSKKLSLPDIYR